ncbi:hypothetical protein tb265_20150 [Gemmatimonadetes bacterium T265]|nr:hypothetical protein tb265_20150 [Gemmatimonadetes bacterium T265]
MPPEVFIVPFVFGIPAVVVLAFRWFRHREHMAALAPPRADVLEARLEHLQRAVEAVAVEVERIGEGQRFLTRAAAERALPQPDLPAARGRVVTPH